MRALGILLLALSLVACGEEPDPYAGYTESEQRWLRLQDYEPGTDIGDASIEWATSVCKVYEAGGDASDVFDELDGNGWNNQLADYELTADINSAHRIFCPDA